MADVKDTSVYPFYVKGGEPIGIILDGIAVHVTMRASLSQSAFDSSGDGRIL